MSRTQMHSRAGLQQTQPSVQKKEEVYQPIDALTTYVRDLVRQEPEVAACVCLGVGFILGWKLKPW